MPTSTRSSQHGQVLALFALALTALVLGVAVVVDGGFAFAQRRVAQNAADFAAMAGTRIVGRKLTGRPRWRGTAANVEDAIDSVLAANDAQLVSAQYVDDEGDALGNVVGAGSIPNGAFRRRRGGPDRLAAVPARRHRRDRLGGVGEGDGHHARSKHRRWRAARRHPGRRCSTASRMPADRPRHLHRPEPHVRPAQHPGRLRLAEVRARGKRQQVRLGRSAWAWSPTAAASRARPSSTPRSGHPRTRMAAARRSACMAARTRSAA